jgi:mannose-6-phosphate isomerase
VPDAAIASPSQRPWGWFETLAEGEGYKLKRLVIRSGQRLSLQRHRHRSEHWLVAAGCGSVWLEDHQQKLAPGDSVVIPVRCRHRAAAEGPGELVIIELQRGQLLSEDDIERFADDYGRCDNTVHCDNTVLSADGVATGDAPDRV